MRRLNNYLIKIAPFLKHKLYQADKNLLIMSLIYMVSDKAIIFISRY